LGTDLQPRNETSVGDGVWFVVCVVLEWSGESHWSS